jgi:hypothetical protein
MANSLINGADIQSAPPPEPEKTTISTWGYQGGVETGKMFELAVGEALPTGWFLAPGEVPQKRAPKVKNDDGA